MHIKIALPTRAFPPVTGTQPDERTPPSDNAGMGDDDDDDDDDDDHDDDGLLNVLT